jgi:hypothetical protein
MMNYIEDLEVYCLAEQRMQTFDQTTPVSLNNLKR